jgi:hypothetical protein
MTARVRVAVGRDACEDLLLGVCSSSMQCRTAGGPWLDRAICDAVLSFFTVMHYGGHDERYLGTLHVT